jgi:hypothetical protein
MIFKPVFKSIMMVMKKLLKGLESGALVTGLFLEGCKWDASADGWMSWS